MLSKLEYTTTLCDMVDMYNDPYPTEHGGRGGVRLAAWQFCQDASDSLLEAIYTCGWSLHRWVCAAQAGWTVKLDGNKEVYVKPDGTKPTIADWDNAEKAMSCKNAWYWR